MQKLISDVLRLRLTWFHHLPRGFSMSQLRVLGPPQANRVDVAADCGEVEGDDRLGGSSKGSPDVETKATRVLHRKRNEAQHGIIARHLRHVRQTSRQERDFRSLHTMLGHANTNQATTNQMEPSADGRGGRPPAGIAVCALRQKIGNTFTPEAGAPAPASRKEPARATAASQTPVAEANVRALRDSWSALTKPIRETRSNEAIAFHFTPEAC
jgi:hypothetical protein